MELKTNYALLNIAVVDGYGGYPVENQYLKVRGINIAGKGPMSEYRREPDMQELDLKGYYLMPGLIDAHVHLAGGRGSGDYGDTEIMMEPKLVRAMRSVYESQKLLKRGFTSVRDISWNGLYLKRIYGDGILPGPRVIACGPGLARIGGHCDSYQLTEDYVREQHFWAVLADGSNECRKWVRRILREGADQIKFWASGGGNWPTDRITDTHYTLDEMKTICEEAHMIKGTMVCSHAETRETISMSIEAGTDTIEHGEDLDEELAEKMANRGIILVPTMHLLVNWYTDVVPTGDDAIRLIRPDAFLYRTYDQKPTAQEGEAYTKQVKDSFNLAREKGVKIALGSDTVYEPPTEYGESSLLEFKELINCGMPVPEAIKAATLTAAEALGMSHRIGTIEAGKAADLLVVRKDPTADSEVLYDPQNIIFTIMNGRLAVEDGRFAF